MVFLLGATFVSSIIVLQNPRPTHAEGFLYRVTCGVGSLLSLECKKTPTTNPTTPTAPTSPTQPTAPANEPSAPPAPVPPESQPVIVPSEPIAIDNTPLPPLPQVEPIGAGTASQSVSQGSYVAMVPAIRGGNQAVLGASHAVPFEATERGWRIFGALWYWWITFFAGVLVLWVIIQRMFIKEGAPAGGVE